MESNGFDRREIMDGRVKQLQLNIGAGVIYAVTDTSVSCSYFKLVIIIQSIDYEYGDGLDTL